MVGCKNQLIMKYYTKFLVPNICHIDFITYSNRNYHCKHPGIDFLSWNINKNWLLQDFN